MHGKKKLKLILSLEIKKNEIKNVIFLVKFKNTEKFVKMENIEIKCKKKI